jgi:hypothetical protein
VQALDDGNPGSICGIPENRSGEQTRTQPKSPVRQCRRPNRAEQLAATAATRLPWLFVDSTHLASGPAARPSKPAGWRAKSAPLLAAAAGIGAVALLHFRDPHVDGSYGYCPVYALTGIYCPGCGGMRAVHNLTDGRIIDSLHSNLIAIPLLATFAIFVGMWTVRAWRGQRMTIPQVSRPLLLVLLVVIIIYSVLRNTPWGTWLAPV